jgi:hypothetical protein
MASAGEIPPLLAILTALQVALLARLVAASTTEPAPPEKRPEPESFITAEEAAQRFAVPMRWLYRHARQIPGAHRLSRKCLRFSESGLRRFMATRRA